MLTFSQARRVIKRSEPQAGVQSCERVGPRLMACRVVVTLAYVEVLREGRLIHRHAVRRPLWMAVGPRGARWAMHRDELDIP